MVWKVYNLAEGVDSDQLVKMVLLLRSDRWWWILIVLPSKKSRKLLASCDELGEEGSGEDEVLCTQCIRSHSFGKINALYIILEIGYLRLVIIGLVPLT